jgi:hypothetical protein
MVLAAMQAMLRTGFWGGLVRRLNASLQTHNCDGGCAEAVGLGEDQLEVGV